MTAKHFLSVRCPRTAVHAMRGGLAGLQPGVSVLVAQSAAELARSTAHADAVDFFEAICRNCGAPRPSTHCAACGQKAVKRLSARDVAAQAWERYRVFDFSTVSGGSRVLRQPGLVAREFVLGGRKGSLHPLKLLLVAVALMVVMLDRTSYLTMGQEALSEQMSVVAAWGRWSFSLGLFSVFGAAWCVFGRRLGYNLTEQLVLAAYVQFVVIALNVLNMLPLLVLDTAQWVPAWRAASAWYMTPLELAVAALAFKQFYCLSWTRDGAWIALALGLQWIFKKAMLFGYGRLVYEVALSRR